MKTDVESLIFCLEAEVLLKITYGVLWWVVTAVILNNINTCKKSIISFSPLWKLLMRSDLRSFTYTNVCSVAVMCVLGGAAPCDCCHIRRDFQSTNLASSRVFFLEHTALFSLRLLDLALNITSAAVELLNPFHNLMAHSQYIHPFSLDFNGTRRSLKVTRQLPIRWLSSSFTHTPILQSVSDLHLAAYS